MNFYKCKTCGNITIYDKPLENLSDNKEELIPNTTDAAGEKHVPVVTVDGNGVTVTVGAVEHPMLPAHYITFVLLETSQGYQKKNLQPGEKPVAVFALAEGETAVAAYEYCNLHGLWKAEV